MKSWIEISTARLENNFLAVRAAAGPGAEVLAVIKANAYGHGATLCAPVLTRAGARWLGVTDAEEGIAVRRSLAPSESNPRVLVMSGLEPADAPDLLAHHLTPVAWTPRHLDALESAARQSGQRLSLHLEIDTGMSRQGAAPGPALDDILHRLAASPHLHCEGLFTHLCCSEVPAAPATATARQRFAQAIQAATAAGLQPTYLHLANSSALDEASTTPWLQAQAHALNAQSMVRTGLALYGYTLPLEPTIQPHLNPHLRPVLTWKTRILSLRDLPAGATVGYGATFTSPTPLRLALLPIGYADGFRREASSGPSPTHTNAWVTLHGHRAPVVGRVSMNLTTIDVTAIPTAREGDEVTLLGSGVTAEDHAHWSHTIPYEILCGLRAPRHLRP